MPSGKLISARSPTSGLPLRLSSRTLICHCRSLSLFFHDSAGGVWRADQVTPGKAFTCSEVTLGDLEAFVDQASNNLSVRHQKLLNTHKKLDSLHDRRGHFVAVTEEAPGIATFDGIKWSKTRTYITGPVVKP